MAEISLCFVKHVVYFLKQCVLGIVGFEEMLFSKKCIVFLTFTATALCLHCTCIEYCGKIIGLSEFESQETKTKMVFWICFRLLLKYGKPQLKGFVNVASSKTIYTWQKASNSVTHYHFEESALTWLSSYFYDEYKQYNQSLKNKTQIAEMFQDTEIPHSFVLTLFPKMQTNIDLDSSFWNLITDTSDLAAKKKKQFQNKIGHICDQSVVILNQGDNSCIHKCPWRITIPVWHTCSQHSGLPGITA